jgi:hypothetical protein
MKRHFFGAAGALMAVLVLASCVEDPTAALRTGTVDRVAISRTYVELDVGDELRLTAQAYDAQGNALPDLPAIATSDAAIVAVAVDDSLSGDPQPQTVFTVTAMAPGSASITATAGGVSSSSTVISFPLVFDGTVAVDQTGPQDIVTVSSSASVTFDTATAVVSIEGVETALISRSGAELQVAVLNESDVTGATVTVSGLIFLGSSPLGTLDAATTPDIRRSPWATSQGSAMDVTGLARPVTMYVRVTSANHDMFVKYESATDLPLTIDVDWDTDADVDIYWVDPAGSIFACGGGCTGAKPEQSVHTVAGGAVEYLNIDLYDGDDSNVTVVIQ